MAGTALGEPKVRVSFEFFPPRTEAMEELLWTSVQQLAPLAPDFVSVTYGAGGSTRERTHATIARLLRETTMAPAAHLTCVAASRDEVDAVIRSYREIGVKRIVALRGDPEAGLGTQYQPHPEGYRDSVDLIAGIKRIGDFDVSVATYPEKHPESRSIDDDIALLRRKVDAGADEAITHFIYENDVFEAFVERVQAAGISVPVVPGLMPIHNFTQVSNFAAKAGGTIPRWIAERYERVGDDPDLRRALAIEITANQIGDLIERGFHRIHIYTMNRAELICAIYDALGLTPADTGATA